MAGVFEVFELDVKEALAAFDRQDQALSRPHLLMADIAQYLHNSTRDRFTTQRDPSGTPWAPLNPVYQAEKPKNRDKILTLNGYLSGTLVSQSSDTEAVEGSNLVYAAIQQKGGTIRPKNGRALRVGKRLLGAVKIPARAFLGLSDDDQDEIQHLLGDYLGAAASR